MMVSSVLNAMVEVSLSGPDNFCVLGRVLLDVFVIV